MRKTSGRNTVSKNRIIVGSIYFVIGAQLVSPVLADGAFALEEITVTARQRAESVQDSPMTLQVFSQQAIEDAGIEEISDFVGMTSNMTVLETQNSAFTFINIRGNSQVRNADPSVAVALDGVLSTSALSFSQELFDVQQIEVLKGPQGALYGRGAVGGAINITTQQPTNELEGFFRGGYGNGQAVKMQGGVSGPLIEDKLLFRVAGSYKDTDGFRENVFLGENIDGVKSEAIQTKLLWFPTDDISVDLRISYSANEGAGGQGFTTNAPFFQADFGALPPHLTLTGGDIVFGAPDSPSAARLGNPDNTSTALQGNILGADERETWLTSLKFEWETGLGLFSSITAFDEVDHFQGGEQFPYTSAQLSKSTQYRNSEAFSQELKLTSPGDQTLRWIFGGYYAKTDFYLSYNVQADTDGKNVTRVTDSPVTGSINPTIPFGFSADQNSNEAFALFGQLNYDLTENLELSMALRYDNDQRQQTVKTPFEMIPDYFTFTTGDERAQEFDSVQPKITLRYTPSDVLTLYANYAQAFRSGGFNASGIQERADALRPVDPTTPEGLMDSFEQEDSEAIEFGFKSTLLDGRLQVNGAVFGSSVENQPQWTFIPAINNAQVLRTIDEIEIMGFELEATYSIDENFRVWGSYGYTDAEIKKFSGEPDHEGNKAPYTPDHTVNLGLQYNRQVTLGSVGMEAIVRMDWNRTGEIYYETANFVPREKVDLLNLRIATEFGSGWNVAAWAKNLTNEDYVSEYLNPNGILFYAGLRSYGLDVTKRF